MVSMETVFSAVALVAAPFAGGLLMGVDRKITARMQSRMGPPVLQPFYDVLKLWGKSPVITSRLQPILAFGYLGFSFLSVALLLFGGDLLSIVFTAALAEVCIVTVSMSAKSPYSYLGGRRELFCMLSTEPLMILSALSIYIVTRSFIVENVLTFEEPLLPLLPGAFIVTGIVLLIEMRKSPFDVSASSHAHQEIVRGVYTELSGYTMALVEVGHWIRTVLVLSIASIFWAPNILVGWGLALALLFMVILADNAFPRLSWQRMVKTSWALGFALIAANVLLLVVTGGATI
ncbi:MAG: NADH-quinone oxidoreductase subunit H [Candidatus Verstraetearchaeota archaeon]|nr:NADH-quinone oxidoreductase subunit H [Candidatus Verstraetearchaeota archaeon]